MSLIIITWRNCLGWLHKQFGEPDDASITHGDNQHSPVHEPSLSSAHHISNFTWPVFVLRLSTSVSVMSVRHRKSQDFRAVGAFHRDHSPLPQWKELTCGMSGSTSNLRPLSFRWPLALLLLLPYSVLDLFSQLPICLCGWSLCCSLT